MRLAAAILAAALVFAGAAYGFEGPLRVVATSSDVRSLVEAVGGSLVSVENLAPPAGDPHAVELKPAQVARLRGAALVFRIGLDHEPWLAKARTSARLVDLSRNAALLQTETPRLRADARPHIHGLGNPHYWLDPENARPMTAAIALELGRAIPMHASTFEANRKRFLETLDAGLARWKTAMSRWKGTKAVVVHDTWAYFAARFGIEIVAAAEPVPGVPPTAAELAALIARMRGANLRVFIVDPHSDEALVRKIAHDAVARVVSLAPSVGVVPEARDYISLFDYNVRRFTEVMEAR